MAWLTTPSPWNYRKYKNIQGTSSGSQTNYQIKLTIHWGTGTDNTPTIADIYLNTHANLDFSDVRFTDSDGTTLLSYWLDSSTYSYGANADIWIKIPSTPPNGAIRPIYIYYGNPSQTTITSNGPNTFPVLFDDFSGTLSKWTHESGCSYGGGTVGITTGSPASSANPAMYMTRTDASCGSGATTPLNQLYGGWHTRLYKTSGTEAGSGIVIDIDYSRNYTLYYLSTGNVNLYGPSGLIGSTTSVTTGTWHNFDITRDTSGNWTIYVDGVSRITGNNNTYTTNTKLGIRTTSWPSGSTDYADNIFYRNYVSPEPSLSDTGIQETYTIPLTVSSTPSGAEIYLNGGNTGQTTTQIFPPLYPGLYDVLLKKAGYQDWWSGYFTIDPNNFSQQLYGYVVTGNLTQIICAIPVCNFTVT